MLDLSSLWDFNEPESSEQRFRAALSTASPDDTLILQTQIARTYSLRRNFARAKEILVELEQHMSWASVETRVRYYLEMGRTYSSATHPPESQTIKIREMARSAYMHALELAQNGKLDSLAIDALHMMAFVDISPKEQLNWNRKALGLMRSSSQEEAKLWEGTLHNNIGYALHSLGRYEDALQEFTMALAARQKEGNRHKIRIAHWMIAWTLRALDRLDEALESQLLLEKECAEAGAPDPHVFKELELLYQAMGNREKAEFYSAQRKQVLHNVAS